MSHWVSTWGQAHTSLKYMCPEYKNYTIQMTVSSQLAGSMLRVRVSNREGKRPLKILAGAVQVNGGTLYTLLFDGQTYLRLNVGQERCSESIPIVTQPGDLISVCLAFSGTVLSGNATGESVHCVKGGNFVTAAQFKPVHRSLTACYFNMVQPVPAISSVEVLASEDAGALICFGDSITQQGAWTKPLQDMLLCDMPGKISVINKGIGGNRLLRGPASKILSMCGRSGMDRFHRDVLEEAGAKAVILAIGTNDIGFCKAPDKPEWVTAEDLQKAYEELVRKAKEKGLLVYAATITPRSGDKDMTSAKEIQRTAFNQWLRGANIFDGLLDFDKAIRDTRQPKIMSMAFDSGDHLHPGGAGGKRLALCVRNILKNSWPVPGNHSNKEMVF